MFNAFVTGGITPMMKNEPATPIMTALKIPAFIFTATTKTIIDNRINAIVIWSRAKGILSIILVTKGSTKGAIMEADKMAITSGEVTALPMLPTFSLGMSFTTNYYRIGCLWHIIKLNFFV